MNTRVGIESKDNLNSIRRVLVAEDNESNRRLIQLMLKRLGCNADIVSDGREVIRALEHQTYDLILLNIVMPEMDGFETAKEIRRRYSTPNRPRIIAITAYVLPDGIERCLNAGMDDYILKPFTLNDLIQVLNNVQNDYLIN